MLLQQLSTVHVHPTVSLSSTTKKGKNGQAPKINYNGSISLATTQKRYDVLDGNEYRAYAQQLWGDKYPAEMDTANTDWQDQISVLP